ncbi:MAG: hypothetical protein H7333_06230 [Bdellovibrionales bacterium]|nr:hypothetical protein [Oligoflexia bacterium]
MSQMALATSRAMETMKRNPKVFDAYQKLYKLSLYRPDQTVVFEGFPKNLSPTDAALLIGYGESRNESREESK